MASKVAIQVGVTESGGSRYDAELHTTAQWLGSVEHGGGTFHLITLAWCSATGCERLDGRLLSDTKSRSPHSGDG
jgi:hypothetical protein